MQLAFASLAQESCQGSGALRCSKTRHVLKCITRREGCRLCTRVVWLGGSGHKPFLRRGLRTFVRLSSDCSVLAHLVLLGELLRPKAQHKLAHGGPRRESGGMVALPLAFPFCQTFWHVWTPIFFLRSLAVAEPRIRLSPSRDAAENHTLGNHTLGNADLLLPLREPGFVSLKRDACFKSWCVPFTRACTPLS